MVAECDRLRVLRVGEAGHDCFGVDFGLFKYHGLKFDSGSTNAGNLVSKKQANICANLIISTSCRVELSGRLTDPGEQQLLDVHVHVFG